MSELFRLQNEFLKTLAHFILWLYDQGYQVTEGEGLRPPEMAKLYAERGTGSANSLHIDKLAHDLNIFRDGAYPDKEWERIGAAWKAMHPLARWGGDFKGKTAGDYGHFSFEYRGRK